MTDPNAPYGRDWYGRARKRPEWKGDFKKGHKPWFVKRIEELQEEIDSFVPFSEMYDQELDAYVLLYRKEGEDPNAPL